jgi:hypothetical protein
MHVGQCHCCYYALHLQCFFYKRHVVFQAINYVCFLQFSMLKRSHICILSKKGMFARLKVSGHGASQV